MRSKDKNVANKGVNVSSDDIGNNNSTSSDGNNVDKVKQDVTTVIELMGPNTPQFAETTETSVYSNEEFSISTEEYGNKSLCKSTQEDMCSCMGMADMDFSVTQEETDNCSKEVLGDSTSPQADKKNEEVTICPPPLYPVSGVFGSECICSQMLPLLANFKRPSKDKGTFVKSLSKLFKRDKKDKNHAHDYYKMNIKEIDSNQLIPKQVIFDLVNECNCMRCTGIEQEIKRDCSTNVCKSKEFKNLNNEILIKQDESEKVKLTDKIMNDECKGTTKVDVYYFDHGNHCYLHTTDAPPKVRTDVLAEKTELYTTKFWAEIFGTCNIGTSFCTSFILQFIRFILYSIIRPLTIGIIQLISDYFFKPFLTTLFNAIVQPILTLFVNIFESIRDILKPFAEGMGYFFREFAVLVNAFRIIEVKSCKRDGMCRSCHKCEKH